MDIPIIKTECLSHEEYGAYTLADSSKITRENAHTEFPKLELIEEFTLKQEQDSDEEEEVDEHLLHDAGTLLVEALPAVEDETETVSQGLWEKHSYLKEDVEVSIQSESLIIKEEFFPVENKDGIVKPDMGYAEGSQKATNKHKNNADSYGYMEDVTREPPSGKIGQTTDLPYVCPMCGRGFRWSSAMKVHIRSHTGEKPYECLTCHRSFALHITCVRHQRTHTGERPFVCTICNRRFTQKIHLQSHLSSHTGEKMFVCPTCHRRFSQHSSLASHIRIHTGKNLSVCQVCQKSFTKRGHLKLHMYVHTGERRYECAVCKKRFSLRSHLVRHMKVHKDKPPSACVTCKKKFPQKMDLTEHIEAHTRQEVIGQTQGFE